MSSNSQPPPRPFLKWLGGKRQLLPELLRAVDAVGQFRHYHEPFIGGGALFFALARIGRLRHRSYLSDVNPNLIDVYLGIRDHVETVINLLRKHKAHHCEEHYYAVRAEVPQELPERAARVIYLNKTCFNGLYRENSKGHFNVPLGRYANPRICDEQNLRAVALTLQQVDLAARRFETIANFARKGDLVYFDPPYMPVSQTADFTSYSKSGFGIEEHQKLANISRRLAQRGIHVIVSNSSSKLVYDLYDDFYMYEVYANRLVNSKANKRGKVPEALVTSFSMGLDAVSPRRKRDSRVLVNSHGIGGLERMLARQWLRENNYSDVAKQIDEVVDEWKSQGKQTRRNWWEILAGDTKGNPRIVSGRKFPILRAAQLRQGVGTTDNALCRNPNEEIPPVRVTKRWPSQARKHPSQ